MASTDEYVVIDTSPPVGGGRGPFIFLILALIIAGGIVALFFLGNGEEGKEGIQVAKVGTTDTLVREGMDPKGTQKATISDKAEVDTTDTLIREGTEPEGTQKTTVSDRKEEPIVETPEEVVDTAPSLEPIPRLKPEPERTAIYFAFDRFDISPKEKEDLAEFYPKVEGRKGQLNLDGHTCSIGTESYNLDLSEKRIRSVQKVLLEMGMKGGDQINVSPKGESNPCDGNDTKEGRRKNRRVEVTFVPED